MRIKENIVKVKECFLHKSEGLVGLIALICFIAILQIKYEIMPCFSIKSKDTNEIIINLSYSYLAGFFFYLLTVILPHLKMRSRVKKALEGKINTITSNYKACVESVVPLPRVLQTNISKDEVFENFKAVSYFQISRMGILQGINITVVSYIMIKHEENKGLATELLEYKPWLSSETIAQIEDIRNSRLPGIISTLTSDATKDQMDNDSGREMLAGFVYDLWELSKRIKY